MMQKENDFGMRLMRNDLWNDLRKRHKDYRHPAKVGCNTYERAFNGEIESLPQTDRWYRNGRVDSVPLINMRYRNGWIESVISHIEYNNRFIVSFGKFFAEVYFFATSC